jgi:hypothetical protein
MDVGMEYAHLLHDDKDLAARTGVAMIPAGPAGRFPNLYCPPWSIPAKSKVKDEAWALAKYLTDREQLLEDAVTRCRIFRCCTRPNSTATSARTCWRPCAARAR